MLYTKFSDVRITIISLLAHLETIGNTHGEIHIYPHGHWGHTDNPIPQTTPRPTRPTRPPTQRPTRAPTTRRPRPARVLIFRTISIQRFSDHLHIAGYLDLRSGGTIQFRFRTLHSQGILFITGRGLNTNSVPYFIALEIVDGRLYVVYDFGAQTKRVAILQNIDVSNGQWHNIRLEFTRSAIIVYLNNRPVRIDLTFEEVGRMYFDGGLNFGGIRDINLPSWYLYSRNGFVGCIGDFELINIGKKLRGNQFNCCCNMNCMLEKIITSNF